MTKPIRKSLIWLACFVAVEAALWLLGMDLFLGAILFVLVLLQEMRR